jgi:phage-related minor tail protein
MSFTQISNVDAYRFAKLNQRINTAIESANEAVQETRAAIKSSQEQIDMVRLALQRDADRQSPLHFLGAAPRGH